jgi:multiple RNA-binding domain-containing protein 1
MKLFCSNIKFFEVNEADLRELFSKYGQVRSIRMPINANGQHRGIAFVEMACDEDAHTAILDLNGTTLAGRRLSVCESRDESKR